MRDLGFTLFDTPIGVCGIVWSAHGVAGVQLPETDERATRARVTRRFGQAKEASPPAPVQHAIDGIVALVSGEPRDLSDVIIDNEGVPEFNVRVYAIARTIPLGKTLTYNRGATGRQVAGP